MTSELRARLEAEGLRPSTWGNGPLDHYAEHHHAYDKVLVAAAGSIVLHVPAGAIELSAGDRLDLPSGTPHAADVGSLGVTCLEAHLPSGTLGREPRLIAGWGISGRAADQAGPLDPAAGERGPKEAGSGR